MARYPALLTMPSIGQKLNRYRGFKGIECDISCGSVTGSFLIWEQRVAGSNPAAPTSAHLVRHHELERTSARSSSCVIWRYSHLPPSQRRIK